MGGVTEHGPALYARHRAGSGRARRRYACRPLSSAPAVDALFPELVWLVCIAFMAGLVDAVVGGGGLVQLPGLFTALP